MIEVRLPLAAFLEHAAALAELPVTTVTLTDRRPWHVSMGGWHWWERAAAINTHDRRSALPPGLFDLLWQQHPEQQDEWDGVRHLNFGRTDERHQPALDALSAACLAYCRTEAAKPTPAGVTS